MFATLGLALLLAAPSTFAWPLSSNAACASVSGDFTIEVQDLYPESAAWDPETCRLYLSSTYNGTLVVYDPRSSSAEIMAIPNVSVSGRPDFVEYHLDGVDYASKSHEIFVVAGAATAFTSTDDGEYSDANYTGPNLILKYDAKSLNLLAEIPLDEVQDRYLAQTGNRTNGFQDIATTECGDQFAIGTYGNSIIRIPHGSNQPELWYVPEEYNVKYGFGGIFSNGNILVISDTISGGLVTFDSRDEVPKPHYVALQNLPQDYKPLMADGLFAPTKYDGRIALWSDDYNGTSIYGSNDEWETATFLGLVLNNDPSAEGGLAVATFEIGDSIFVLTEFFQMKLPIKPKASFPIFDITDQVDEFVRNSTFGKV